MSIRFDGNIANYLSRVTSVPNYNGAYTAIGWLKWKVDNAATQAAFSLSPVSASNSFDFFGITSSDDYVISSRLDDDNIQSTGGSVAVIDKWVHWAVVRNSVTDIRIYIDLVEDAQATIDITGRTAADICSIGRLSVSGDGFVPLDGETAFVRIWTTDLTTTELAAERLSRRAVKTASLFGDYPMLTAANAGDDVSGNANHFTVNGTIATGTSEPPLIAGPSLFRGRLFTFFDDEQVNRFEFWSAITAGISLEVPIATVSTSAVAPAVTLGALTLAVESVTVPVTVIAPAVTLGAVSVVVPVVMVTTSATAPQVTLGAVTLTAPSVVVPVTTVAPVVTVGAVIVAVPVVTVASSVIAPDIQLSVAVPIITVTTTVITPQVSLGGVSISASVVSASVTVIAPSVVLGAVIVDVPLVDVAVAVVAPVVNLGAVSLAVPVISVSTTVVTPVVRLSVEVPVVTVAAQVVAPSITLGVVSIAVPVISIGIAAVAPLVSVGGVVEVPVVTVNCTVTAPLVTVGSVVLSVPTVSVTIGVTVPAVSLGVRLLTVPVTSVSVSAVAPSVVSVAGITVPAITIPVTVTAPTIRLWSTPPGRTFMLESEPRAVVVQSELRMFKVNEDDREEVTN